MKKLILVIILSIMSMFTAKSQINDFVEFKPDYITEQIFEQYVHTLHMFEQNWTTWKQENKVQYAMELWYYGKSFYIKRNVLSEGIKIDESMIDVSRFESSREESTEAIILIPGFRDAIILLPIEKLIYNPNKK